MTQSAENDAAEPCVCGSGFTCMARHDAPTERERLAQKWADHYGHDGTTHANIGLGLGCRFGSALRDDVCHPRVIPAGVCACCGNPLPKFYGTDRWASDKCPPCSCDPACVTPPGSSDTR